jgi:hypothetical protein
MRIRNHRQNRVGAAVLAALITLFPAHAFSQAWAKNYEDGLEAAKAGKWMEARQFFLKSKSDRKDDTDAPTILPVNETEKIEWKNGALYSPNFLAAYASFQLNTTNTDPAFKPNFKEAAEEFESLLKKKQVSPEAIYYLSAAYRKLGQTKKIEELPKKYKVYNWKVDTSLLSDEDKKAVKDATPDGATGPIRITQSVDAAQVGVKMTDPKDRAVPYLEKKFALIIANGATKGQGLQVPSAEEDGRCIQEALSKHAGYKPDQVELVLNGGAQQMKAAAEALAARMPQDGVLFIFYTGAATNVDGKDYLAGVETELVSDTASMLPKLELYEPFLQKGVKLFAFYQVARPISGGRFFGTEEPKYGIVSQSQSTIPGEQIFSINKGGKARGIYADAMCQVFADLRSNSLPITEFGWQIFYKMRRGGTATTGGSSRQTPTLPMLLQMGPDTRF